MLTLFSRLEDTGVGGWGEGKAPWPGGAGSAVGRGSAGTAGSRAPSGGSGKPRRRCWDPTTRTWQGSVCDRNLGKLSRRVHI